MYICSVLFSPYDILQTRILHTTKDLCYLLNIYCGINTRTCLFLFRFYILQLRTWTWSHVVLADLDVKLVDLDLTVAGIDTFFHLVFEI